MTQQLSISQAAEAYIPDSWEHVFESLSVKDEFEFIDGQIQQHGQVYYPSNEDIFRAFHLTPIDSVKVVIFGQDPYPQSISTTHGEISKACGCAFGLRAGDSDIPGSLVNIYNEIKKDIPDFEIPNHGDLTSWAVQGVLLLNVSLTVPKGQPGGHGKIWMGFIKQILKAIIDVNPNCAFVLWGNYAKDAWTSMKIKGNYQIFEASHPSSRAVYGRTANFIGCKHFSKINTYLKSIDRSPIDWSIPNVVYTRKYTSDKHVKNVTMSKTPTPKKSPPIGSPKSSLVNLKGYK